jgi:hypothetical protein
MTSQNTDLSPWDILYIVYTAELKIYKELLYLTIIPLNFNEI